jgi:LPS sulfotransferase NodH
MTIGDGAGTDRKVYDLLTAKHDYALSFAGGLGCPLEYYHAGFRPTAAARWQAPSLTDFAAAVTTHRTDPSGTLSVKLFWRDVAELAIEIDPARFAFLTESLPAETGVETYRAIADLLGPLFPAPVYIHLFRRDRVRQAISTVAANDTGQWRHIPDIDERESVARPRFDLDRIEKFIGYSDFCHDHWRNFFAAIGATPFVMTYEELAANYDDAVTRVLRFLGSDGAPPPIRMRRQADEQSEAVVLRFLRERAAAAAASP